MKTAIKWGILGTSAISATLAKAIQESPTSELIAIASRSGSLMFMALKVILKSSPTLGSRLITIK